MFRILLFITLFCGWNLSHADLQVAKEYQIKSVFLYNFASFIKWPSSVFISNNFYICILGQDQFKQTIDITVENENILGHPIMIKRLNKLESDDICQILFVSKSEIKNITNILSITKNTPVLTISDIDLFVEQGGMIQFFNRDKKIRFLINPNKVKATGLYVSGNLLRIAKIYHAY